MTNENVALLTRQDRRGSLDIVLNVRTLLKSAGLWKAFIANIVAHDDIPKHRAEQWFYSRTNESPGLIIQKAFPYGTCKHGTPEQWNEFQKSVNDYFSYHPLNNNYIYLKK